jgi:hypothetical protein
MMITHDPFQTLGAYSGAGMPYGLPYQGIQNPINPLAFAGQSFSNPGIGGYGVYPQQLQGPGVFGQQVPWHQQIQALQNPLLHHALTQNVWQNPLASAGLQTPFLNPLVAATLQQNSLQNPLQALAYGLAPQSQIGAIGQPFGQVNPLAQLGGQQYGQVNPLAQLGGQQFGQINPLAQFGGQQYGQVNPLAQWGQQFGQVNPLAQWGGQQYGQGNPLSQISPLAQLALRQATGYSTTPFAGCF